MAKSKSRSLNEEENTTEKEQVVFTPIRKKYKPIPMFNGKCKNC